MINKALTNVAPLFKVKQLKQKKKRYKLKEFSYIVKNKNRISLSLKLFINKTKTRTTVKAYKKLRDEFFFAAKKIGTNVNQKKNLYEYAFIKKKYYYYR